MPSEEIDRDEEENGEGEEEVAPPPRGRTTRASTSTSKKNSPPGVGGNAGNMIGRARTKEDGTPNSKWQSHEAELLWPEVVSYLEGVGKSPYDVEAQIVRVSPTGPDGAVGLGSIDGQALTGDAHVSPGERLMQLVTDTKHMPTARGPARYEVRFTWKLGAGRIGTGILNLPSPAEIMALRNASMQQQYESQQQQPGVGAPQQRHPQASPHTPPQQQWPQPPPWWAQQQPYGYGAPPPWMQPQQGLSPEMSAMQAELAATRGALNEALAAAREGRQPRVEGVAATPPPMSEDALAEKVTARVIMALQGAGVFGAPKTVAAPPAASATVMQDAVRGKLDNMLSGIFDKAIDMFGQTLHTSVKQAMGVGAPPEEAAAEIAEPEPAKDEFKTPFNVAAVEDVRWPDGSPVRYAADRESGDISPMGLAFGNPYIVEKGMNLASGLTEALTDALKGLARGGLQQPGVGKPPLAPAPQVVREIPRAAEDATPTANETPPNGSGFPSL